MVSFRLLQGANSMFQVFLTGNNSEYFTISPTAVQGRADIRVRVALPLDFERIRSYSFSVSFLLKASMTIVQTSVRLQNHEASGAETAPSFTAHKAAAYSPETQQLSQNSQSLLAH